MPRRRGEDEDDMTMWQMRTMTRKRKIMTMRIKITAAAAVGESIRRRDGTGRSFSIWRHKRRGGRRRRGRHLFLNLSDLKTKRKKKETAQVRPILSSSGPPTASPAPPTAFSDSTGLRCLGSFRGSWRQFWSVVVILSSDFFNCCPCPMLFVGIVGFLGDHACYRWFLLWCIVGCLVSLRCGGVKLPRLPWCFLSSNLRNHDIGKQTHAYLLRHGIQFEGTESYLIDRYAKSGLIRASQQNFERNHTGDTDQATWNAMIAGYTRNGLVEEAFITFRQMFEQNVTPNVVNIASVLPACNPMGNIELAIWASNFMDFLSPICWTKMSL
ncbi:hypothetical protein Pint_36513 [Pistacia integerrima]|uniref:Uncharacterized protein n=1 Tax=Pistacia integerrima TaxID=434235 RepID=A0ACC0Y3M4_9ROSI|nr:hypothetical protein Pint_36513 [Pistacia integerrima]